MTRKLAVAGVVLLAVVVAAVAAGSLIDPENIGGRLALYALGALALLAAIVLFIVAIVKRSRPAP